MAHTYYGAMREPLASDEAPLSLSPLASPPRCAKCDSLDLAPAYHRDLIACVLLHDNDEQTSAHCSGEHLHWQCRECGHDYTSACADGDDE